MGRQSRRKKRTVKKYVFDLCLISHPRKCLPFLARIRHAQKRKLNAFPQSILYALEVLSFDCRQSMQF